MKGIIFNTEKEAMDMDWKHNKLTGSVSRYHFNRVPLKATTTLTKSAYAELYDIPETLEDENGVSIPNPQFEALEDSYTLQKYAGIVGDALDYRDGEGNLINYSSPYDRTITFDVVEITEDMLLPPPEL